MKIASWMRTPLLELQIIPSFESPTIYKIIGIKPHQLSIVVYEGPGGYDWGGIAKEQLIDLEPEEYDEIVLLLDAAINAPKKDATVELDGEYWLLESNLYLYTKFAVWSPEYATEKRGLSEIVSLTSYLRELKKAHE